MAGRRSLAVLTALLVVLAGCSAFGAGVPGSDSPDTTTESGIDESVGPIYEPPLNTTEVAVDHVVALRRAGSFEYRATVTIVDSNQSAQVQFGRQATVEMDSGEMLVTRNDTGMRSTTFYVTGNGSVYTKAVSGTTSVSFNVTEGTMDTSRYAINGVPRFLDMFDLTYDGYTTLDGEPVYRYSATSVDQVNSLSAVGQSGNNDSLSSIEATLYVTESGLIKRAGYALSFDTGQGMHNIKAVTTYERLGSATVSAPDWIADAKAADSGQLNVTRTLENETLGAELTLTANRGLFDRIRLLDGPGPLYSGNHTYEAAAVSKVVTAVIPPTATNVSMTLAYDEAAVPEGGESELAVYRYSVSTGSWVPVAATQDQAADEFTVDLTRSAPLVVMHEPTWQSTGESAHG